MRRKNMNKKNKNKDFFSRAKLTNNSKIISSFSKSSKFRKPKGKNWLRTNKLNKKDWNNSTDGGKNTLNLTTNMLFKFGKELTNKDFINRMPLKIILCFKGPYSSTKEHLKWKTKCSKDNKLNESSSFDNLILNYKTTSLELKTILKPSANMKGK